MNKKNYLEDPEVESFVNWLKQHIKDDSLLKHNYMRPGGKLVEFRNLGDALEKYDWPFNVIGMDGERYSGSSYNDNVIVLNQLKNDLHQSVLESSAADQAALSASIAIMKWGGVLPGNGNWLRNHKNGLAALLRGTAHTLAAENDDLANFTKDLRFNAGMTKIYSMLLKNFVIYDSRVAAALAWLVMVWLQDSRARQADIPKLLNFPCMPAKEGTDPEIRKLRNPSAGGRLFQKMKNPSVHAHWNLRASWIIAAVIDQSAGTAFHRTGDPVRALEAALFMWGYDLSRNSPWVGEQNGVEPDDDDDSASEECSVEPGLQGHASVTLGNKALPFQWIYDEGKDAIIIRRKNGRVDTFSIDNVFQILHWLYDQFGEDWIPLANNFVKLKDRTEKIGLGMAIMEIPKATIELGQAASYLGPILTTIGLFTWNQKNKNIAFYFRTSPPVTIQALRDLLQGFLR